METRYSAGTIPVPVALPSQKVHVLFGGGLGFFFPFKQHSLLPQQVEVFHSAGANSRIWGFFIVFHKSCICKYVSVGRIPGGADLYGLHTVTMHG